MKLLILSTLILFAIGCENSKGSEEKAAIYNIDVTTIDGKKKTLEEYGGQVLLIVNTASR